MATKNSENTVEQHIHFPDVEEKILAFWEKEGIFEKSLEQRKNAPVYNFYDGPPFATGLPHHGHLLASTLKDIIPRYFTMQGYYISRRFGWDCHGLPIEHEIDKQFGKSTAEIVAEKGIAAYINACRSIVQRHVSQWRSTINRLGRWVDFDNDYKTMDVDFMESVWWVFKTLWEKKLIYKGIKVVPYSTALATGLSNFEASSNYQEVQDPSVTILLALEDEDAYLAIWTTTPWTLPSNLGVCIGSKIPYVKVRNTADGKIWYCAKDRYPSYAEKIKSLEIVCDISADTLIGRSYTPLFPYFTNLKNEGAFKIFSDDFVSTEDGTGLVHMAPAFGEEDHRVMKAAGIHTFACPIDAHGKFTEEVPDFQGQYVKDADKSIIRTLKDRGLVLLHESFLHSYPFCPRSDTPLIYRAIPSWYVKVESLKEGLIQANQDIHWVPSHIKDGRFGKWLENARDWAISRDRVWGTPLPIWENEQTGKRLCIGSRKELEQYTHTTLSDLHRDHIDNLSFSVANEDGIYRHVGGVLDCWFESGAMPYAQAHYPFENKQRFHKGFPADFIAEGLDQTRGWFYTLNVLSVALFNKPAFKNVIVNGIVMAEDGKKMSKRLANYTQPDLLMQKYGADALRLYLIDSGLVKAEEQRFRDHDVKEIVRRTLLPWYHAFKFLHTYGTIDHWQVNNTNKTQKNILDLWIISRLHTLLGKIQTHMEAYALYHVVPELLHFIEELTNIYIRLNRNRFWTTGLKEDKLQAYHTLYTVIYDLTRALAPFAPFLAEHIFQQLKCFHSTNYSTAASVHLCDYPKAQKNLQQPLLEQAVTRLQQIIVLGRQLRNTHKIKTKIPLKSLTIIHKDPLLLDEIKKLESYLLKELNVYTILYKNNESDFVRLFAKPCSPRLGKRLGKNFALFRKKIEALTAKQILNLETTGTLTIAGEIFAPEDILVYREALTAGDNIACNRLITIQLDLSIDDEQRDAGLARELVNRIQKARKTLDLAVDARINVQIEKNPKLEAIIKSHTRYIQEETLTSNLQFSKHLHNNENNFYEEIDDCIFKFTILTSA
jgi:isoleucyl-tRNA synthetase